MHLIAASFDDIVRLQIPLWDKVLRTVAVYSLIYMLIRLAKRDGAQLTASDFVVLLLLSNVVQNALIGPDDSLLGGAIGAVTLIVVNELVARWEWRRKTPERSEPAGPIVMLRSLWATRTDPVRVIADGRPREEAMRGLGIAQVDLFAELRRMGVGDPSRDVDWAELRTGGTIDYELKDAAQAATKGDVDDLHRELRELRDAVARLSMPG